MLIDTVQAGADALNVNENDAVRTVSWPSRNSFTFTYFVLREKGPQSTFATEGDYMMKRG